MKPSGKGSNKEVNTKPQCTEQGYEEKDCGTENISCFIIIIFYGNRFSVCSETTLLLKLLVTVNSPWLACARCVFSNGASR